MKEKFIENGIEYVRNGDYYIPSLTVPDDKVYNIGKYGRMHAKFIKDNRPTVYSMKMLNGTWLAYLEEIDTSAKEMVDRLVKDIAELMGQRYGAQGQEKPKYYQGVSTPKESWEEPFSAENVQKFLSQRYGEDPYDQRDEVAKYVRNNDSLVKNPFAYTLAEGALGAARGWGGNAFGLEAFKDALQYEVTGKTAEERIEEKYKDAPMIALTELARRKASSAKSLDKTMSDIETAFAENKQRNAGAVKRAYGDIVNSTARMIPSLAMSYGLGASGAPADAISKATGFMTGLSSGGNKAMQAQNEGYDPMSAALSGAASGALEGVLTSKLTGATLGKALEKGAAKETGKSTLKALAKAQGRSFLSEATEEAVTEPLTMLADWATLGKKPTADELKELPGQMLYSGLLGGISGAVMSAPIDIANAIDSNRKYLYDEYAPTEQNTKKAGQTAGTNPSAADMVSSFAETMARDKGNRVVGGIVTDEGFDAAQIAADMVSSFAETMEGDNGKRAMTGLYNPSQNPTDYIKSMMGVYNAGKQGVPQARVDTGVLNTQQADAAYAAGQMDGMKGQTSGASQTLKAGEGKDFSVKTGRNGIEYTHIDAPQDMFDGVSVEKMPAIVRKYLVDKYRNQVLDVSEDKAYFSKGSAEEYSFPAKRIKGETKEAKMRAATELDNLLATARDKRHEEDTGHHPEATGGWDYYTTNFVVDFKNENGDVVQKEFVGTVKVMNTDQGRRFHDITEIEEVTSNTRGVSGINPPPAVADTSSVGNMVSQNDPSVNTSIRQSNENDTSSGQNLGEIPTNSENARESTPRPLQIADTDSAAVKTAKRVANILTERFGVEFEMYAADDGMDGHFDPGTKKIYINENAESPMLSVVAHEFLHAFKTMDPQGYAWLKRITESDLNLAQFNEYKKALLAAYDEKGIAYKHLNSDALYDLVVEEAMSDLMGEIINDPSTIERIARQDRNLAQRIIDVLGEIIDSIRMYFTESDTEIQKLVNNYEQVKAIYQEMVGTSGARMENVSAVDGGKRYSIYKVGNKLRVVVDNDILKGVHKKDIKKTVKNYIRTAYKDGVISLDGKMKTHVDKQGAEEFVYSNYTSELSNAERMDKYRMGGNLDEIIQSQQNSQLENTKHERDDDIVSFYRSDVQVQVGAKLYECKLITALTSDGREKFYDVVDLDLINEKEGNPSLADKIQVNGRHGSPSLNRIPQDDGSVNTSIRQSNQNDTSADKIDLAKGERASVFRKGSRAEKAQNALDEYETTGKTSALPDQKWVRQFHRDTVKMSKYLRSQISATEFEMDSAKTEAERKGLQKKLDDLRARQEQTARALAVDGNLLDAVRSEMIPRNYQLADVIDDIKDVDTGLKIKNGNYRFNDLQRNLERVFGKHYHLIKPMVDAFEIAKGDASRLKAEIGAELYSYIQKELGIKKGSKESKAVQWIAEGERNPIVKNADDLAALKAMGIDNPKKLDPNIRVPYNREMLYKEFDAETAERIIKAEEWFREKYDMLIDEINQTQRLIYPNRPDKLVQKRKDYMRHFREIESGWGGLVNIVQQDASISPKLAGISENTKPKEMWASIKQRRKGRATAEGAVEGFMDYLPQATQAIHINPFIEHFRGLARDLAELKAKTDNGDLNGFIEYLNDFANDLAGKTGGLDRQVLKSLGSGGRKMLRALNWFNNRTKANAVVGNLASTAKQVMNIPNGMMYMENPADILPGLRDTFRYWLDPESKRQADEHYKDSDFLTERFSDKVFSKFEKPGIYRGTTWLLGIADEMGTRSIWNGLYREAQKNGLTGKDAAAYADKLTRKAVDTELPKDKKTVSLTEEQLEEYQKLQNKELQKAYAKVTNTPEYRQASDASKKVMLKDARKTAKAAARVEMKKRVFRK